MRVSKALTVAAVLGQLVLMLVLQDSSVTDAAPQQPSFELPVQLIGFPVIIIAVRLSNFVKKLAYSLNPKTYTGRVRRAAITGEELIDMAEAEKRLVSELGEDVCVYTRVCLQYAHRAQRNKNRSTRVLDWEHILRQYKRSPDKNKEFYLLSVFLGDIVGSPKFCQQLAKRGRACAGSDE